MRYAVSVYLSIVIFWRRDRHGNACESSLLPLVRGIGLGDVNVLFYDKVDRFVTGNKKNERLLPRNVRVLFYLPLKSVFARPNQKIFDLNVQRSNGMRSNRLLYCPQKPIVPSSLRINRRLAQLLNELTRDPESPVLLERELKSHWTWIINVRSMVVVFCPHTYTPSTSIKNQSFYVKQNHILFTI